MFIRGGSSSYQPVLPPMGRRWCPCCRHGAGGEGVTPVDAVTFAGAADVAEPPRVAVPTPGVALLVAIAEGHGGHLLLPP